MAVTGIRILAIVPYKGLQDQLISYVATRDDIKLEVYIGELNEAAEIARNKEHDFDVILSRGGTAEAIEKVVNIPVVTLRPTVFDLLRIMKMTQAYSGKYAIIGFSDITQDFHAMLDILQINAEIYTITDASQVETCILSLKSQHYSMIIGDVIAVNTAKRLHMNGILITSGLESIQIAVDEAIQIHNDQLRMQEMKSLMDHILEHLGRILVVYNQDRSLLFRGGTPDKIPRIITTQMVGSVGKVLEKGTCEYSRTIDGKLYHVSGYSDIIDNSPAAVFVIASTASASEVESSVYQYFNEQDDVSEALIDNIGKMSEVYDLAHRFALQKQPVIIVRETGIEDFDIARSLHRNGANPDTPMLVIDFANCKKKDMDFLINNDRSPLSNNEQCIFIRNIEKLTQPNKHAFLSYVNDTSLFVRNKLIVSMTIDELRKTGPLLSQANITCLQIPIPALRERKDDIISLATLFLNSYSMQSGRPAISFDAEAEREIKDYPWFGNTRQLKRVVRCASLITDTLTIPYANVRKALDSEQYLYEAPTNDQQFLTGTLDQINKKIVNRILLQENMNKTRTANRLGISRGTLWRIIKDNSGDTADEI